MTDPLFAPIAIGTLQLPNRIVMAPMGQGKASGGLPDEGYPAYYARRATGGAGLIVSGALSANGAALARWAALFQGQTMPRRVRLAPGAL